MKNPAPSPPPEKPARKGALRPALLAAARTLLDREGADAVTIRAVARACGVSHAAPANHFADRRSLLTALAAELFADLAETMENALAGAPQNPANKGFGTARLTAFGEALVAYGLAHPERYRLLWRRDLLDGEDAALQGTMDRLYARLLEELSALPLPAGKDPETAAVGLWSLCHGYISMRLDGNFIARRDKESGAPRHSAMIANYLAALAPQAHPA
jgi:AcrR family transcriptional regulator